jgi:8-oxo-dGTP pyrophosphatase MutT (NUDIX family)
MENTNNNNKIEKVSKMKIYKSASLTFYNELKGYLICEEYRKNNKKQIHPIGGKVEEFDKDLLETAIREFVEETNLEHHEEINKAKLNKSDLVEKIKITIKDNIKYKDICINKKLNYYHRYYKANLDNISNDNFKLNITDLSNFFNGVYKTEIESIQWIKKSDLEDYRNNFSWLSKMMFIILFEKK